jgi:hypothetical protein
MECSHITVKVSEKKKNFLTLWGVCTGLNMELEEIQGVGVPWVNYQ